MGNPAELVDVVDTDDIVVDIVARSEMRARNMRHRSVAIVVIDDTGRVLVHRRALDKDVWPGQWDLAGGGLEEARRSMTPSDSEAVQFQIEPDLVQQFTVLTPAGSRIRVVLRPSFDNASIQWHNSFNDLRHLFGDRWRVELIEPRGGVVLRAESFASYAAARNQASNLVDLLRVGGRLPDVRRSRLSRWWRRTVMGLADDPGRVR